MRAILTTLTSGRRKHYACHPDPRCAISFRAHSEILGLLTAQNTERIPPKNLVAVRIEERRLRFRFRFAVGSFDRTDSSRRTGTRADRMFPANEICR